MKNFKVNNDGKYDIRIETADASENVQIMDERVNFNLIKTDEEEDPNQEENYTEKVESKTDSEASGNNEEESADGSDTAPGSKEQDVTYKDGQELSISLNYPVLMLTLTHYNFADLKATVTPKNAKVRFESKKESIATVSSKKGKVRAKGYGTTKIIATATYKGKTAKATCNIRVIGPSTLKTSDSGPYVNTRENGSPKTYYIRNYESSKDLEVTKWSNKRTEAQHWSNEEVESYINNAAYLIKTYPNKFDESKEQKFYIRGATSGRTVPSTVKQYVKPKNEIVVNGGKYILLFTTKNQCLYLLKRNNDGVWKLEERVVASAGYYWGPKYSNYLVSGHNIGYYAFEHKGPGTTDTRPTNAVHTGTTYGRPASGGCILSLIHI